MSVRRAAALSIADLFVPNHDTRDDD